MRTRLAWALGTCVFAVSPLFAQIPTPPNPPAPPASSDAGLPSRPPEIDRPLPPSDPMRFWVRGELLAYWVKDTPLPVSLVTGDPNNPTQELLNRDRDFGMFSGFRLALGMPIDPYNNIGLDLGLYSLQPRNRRFFASSDGSGSPILAFPFINQTPGAVGATIWPVASPGQFAGSVAVINRLALWGLETNASLYLVNTNYAELTALVGLRYDDLRERLTIDTLSAALATTPHTILFQSDAFRTRNQFYGGQVGGRLRLQGDRFGFNLTGKVALGATRQIVEVQGFSSQTGPGGVNGTFPGGFFTQPSNLGRRSATDFTVAPSIETKFYWLISTNLHAFIGYDFMYWSQVVRPGDQVDRNINLTQSGTIFSNGGPNGPTSPGPLFTRSDFWAQGISLGLELRF